MATNKSTVQNFYIAYYGRAADPFGLNYWINELTNQGGDISAIIDSFATSDEFSSRYGGLSNDELIDGLYRQMYSREPDAEGKAFYLGKLDSGELSLQSIAIDILNGTQGSDIDILQSKAAVAEYFTLEVALGAYSYSGDESAESVKTLLDSVSSASVSPQEVVDDFIVENGGAPVAVTSSETIVGSWALYSPDGMYAVNFFEDGTFHNGAASADDEGVEYGTYNWDPATGALSTTVTLTDNTEGGFANAGSSLMAIVQGGSLLFSSDDGFSAYSDLHRDSLDTLEGGWRLLGSDDDTSDASVVFTDTGQYIVYSQPDSDDLFPGSPTELGAEYGTYTWDSISGDLTVTPIIDGDGDMGFYADVGDYVNTAESAFVDGNILTVGVSENGVTEFVDFILL